MLGEEYNQANSDEYLLLCTDSKVTKDCVEEALNFHIQDRNRFQKIADMEESIKKEIRDEIEKIQKDLQAFLVACVRV